MGPPVIIGLWSRVQREAVMLFACINLFLESYPAKNVATVAEKSFAPTWATKARAILSVDEAFPGVVG